jgi:hypothetical protein
MVSDVSQRNQSSGNRQPIWKSFVAEARKCCRLGVRRSIWFRDVHGGRLENDVTQCEQYRFS